MSSCRHRQWLRKTGGFSDRCIRCAARISFELLRCFRSQRILRLSCNSTVRSLLRHAILLVGVSRWRRVYGPQATAAGAKEQEAINFLEKKLKSNPEFSYAETVQVRPRSSPDPVGRRGAKAGATRSTKRRRRRRRRRGARSGRDLFDRDCQGCSD